MAYAFASNFSRIIEDMCEAFGEKQQLKVKSTSLKEETKRNYLNLLFQVFLYTSRVIEFFMIFVRQRDKFSLF